MARGKKKETILTPEEKLQEALVPESEWPYKVPKNWRWVRFGFLAKEMADGPFGSNLKTEHYTKNKEARIIQLGNISEEGWKEDNTKYTTFEHAKEISRSIVEPGNIVIAKMMPAGRAIICPNNEKMYVLSSDAVKMVPIESINAKYLVIAINSPYFRNQVQENTQGITRARTSIKKLKEYPFVIPPLPEQQRIVDRIESLFSKLDEAKEKAQAVVDGFEDRKAAILHKAFTGGLTEGWRGDHNISIVTWDNVKLSEACKINPPKINVKALPDNLEVSFFPMPALSEIYGAITEPQTRLLSDVRTGFTNFSEGDVVFAKITPCMENGKSAVIGPLVNNIGFGTTEFFVLRCNDRLYNRFLWHLVRDRCFRNEAKAVMTGAVGQQRVPKSFLENYHIALPSVEEQKEIVRILDKCFEKELQVKEAAEQVIAQIDTMKKSILARAFRGELGTNNPSDESAEELLKRIL